ncbi:MAG: TraB/GumN family protein [Caulobacteraceae bacterium]|nr:TraB/GumN family protein [Caulobacteraceae bacterium]
MKYPAAIALPILLALGAASPAGAIDDPEATTVDELVVQARLPGPAWWRVSDADSTVYVMGVPDALPKGMRWDQTVLKRRLKGANTLITPPVLRASANPLTVPRLLAEWNRISHGSGLAQEITPALLGRFNAAVLRAGKKPKDYQTLRAWFAGVRLAGDYRKRAGLDFSEPLRTIYRAAKAARVKPVPALAEDTKAATLLAGLRQMPPSVGPDCLTGAVEEVEAGDSALRRAAQGWAAGSTTGALSAPRSSERCYMALQGAARIKREAMGAQADAIATALRRPGHGVAVLELRSLVAREGVLQRLRARGYTVTSPAADGA